MLARKLDENMGTYHLDIMTLEDAQRIHTTKGMILMCEDGHVKNIYKEDAKERMA